MPRNREPVPAEIPKDQRQTFAAMRSQRRAIGKELTVEEFNKRNRWGYRGTGGKRNANAPQTKEGALAILRAKGLAP